MLLEADLFIGINVVRAKVFIIVFHPATPVIQSTTPAMQTASSVVRASSSIKQEGCYRFMMIFVL